MKVSVFGSGYVGLVTGACLAEVGNDVVCIDVDANKIERLNRGEVPIHEPGLDSLIQRNMASKRLQFTTDIDKAVEHGLFQFIAVGTPPDEDGSADLKYVLAVARSIAERLQNYRVVVNKSTVPVGTADKVRETILAVQKEKGTSVEFDVVSNPEFLKEGAAIDDFMKPDRIVVGTDNPRTTELLRALYAPFNRSHERMICIDIRSAELTKYAANAMLATKISFMNELANLAERLGADIEKVRLGIGSDPRIGYHFIYPGCGYGGSCFPKDVKALERTARDAGYTAELLRAVEAVNNRQKNKIFEKIKTYFDGNVTGKTIALWGLAFKPNTDDMRDAPSRVLLEALWAEGAKVRAYDPVAMNEAQRIYGDRPDFTLCENPESALEGADVLAIVTEWNMFRSPDFAAIKASLSHPAVFLTGAICTIRPEWRRRGFIITPLDGARRAVKGCDWCRTGYVIPSATFCDMAGGGGRHKTFGSGLQIQARFAGFVDTFTNKKEEFVMKLKQSLSFGGMFMLASAIFNPAWAVEPINFQVRNNADLVALCTTQPHEKHYVAAIHFCHGFGVGFYRYYEALKEGKDFKPIFCIPEGSTRAQTLESYVNYSKAHPEYDKELVGDVLMKFLVETYPCKEDTK